MKKLMDRIDRFCWSHPNFGIPRLMLVIVIGNLAVWLFSMMDTTNSLTYMLAFSPEMVFRHGQIWRLVTFLFVPETFGWNFVFWLYMYYFIGNTLEDTWGAGKFTIYFFSGAVLSVVYSTLMWLLTAKSGIVTMHYVYLSMFFAYATLYPDTYLLLFFMIPVKVKWFAIIDAVLFGLGVLFGTFPTNLLPLVALLNYFLFCGQWIGDLLGRGKVQRQKNVIDFQRESRRINREMRDKPYNHKCEICGRTDAEYPDLEFRYCSRCSGYHCYCQDHINNHVHHTD